MNTRITLDDNTMSAIMKLSDGNPGAASVCMKINATAELIDPDAAMGGISKLLSLDSYNIYGPDIWMLYKDVCNEDITKTIACLRACQLGLINLDSLKTAISNCGNGLDIDNMVGLVQEQLPNFAKEV